MTKDISFLFCVKHLLLVILRIAGSNSLSFRKCKLFGLPYIHTVFKETINAVNSKRHCITMQVMNALVLNVNCYSSGCWYDLTSTRYNTVWRINYDIDWFRFYIGVITDTVHKGHLFCPNRLSLAVSLLIFSKLLLHILMLFINWYKSGCKNI